VWASKAVFSIDDRATGRDAGSSAPPIGFEHGAAFAHVLPSMHPLFEGDLAAALVEDFQ